MIKRDMFPKVYFSNIELDWKGNPDRRSNPHIRDDADRSKKSSLAGPTTWVQKKAKAADINPEDELNITVELQLEVPQVENRVFNNFFDREFYEKYLKVKIIQVDDPSKLKKITSRFGNVPITEFDSMSAAGEVWSQNLSIKNFNLSLDQESEEEIERNVIRVNYFNKNRDPDFLAYVAFSFLDVQAIEQDFEEIDAISELFYSASDIFIEVVFNQGRVVSEAFLFFDEENRVFNGAVEFDGENYLKLGTDEVLRQTTVENNTVVDFRSLRQFEKAGQDFIDVLNNINIFDFSNRQKSGLVREVPRQYFSDCFVTADPDGRSRLAFALNQKNIIKYESAFPWIIEGAGENKLKEILSRSTIRSLEVYRRRVEESGPDDWRVFGSGELELVSRTSEESHKNLKNKRTEQDLDGDGVKETLTSLNREVDFPQTGARLFTFSDEYMRKIGEGWYNYIISLSMNDGTVSYLADKVGEIQSTMKQFSSYRNSLANSGKYDPFTQKFAPEYIEKLRNIYEGAEFIPWVDIPLSLVESVDSIKSVDPQLFHILKEFMHPNTVSLESLAAFEKFMDGIILSLEDQLKSVGGSLSNTEKSWPRQSSVKRSSKFLTSDIEIQKNIGGTFNSESPKRFGIDFLDYVDSDGKAVSFKDESGLKTIDGRDYEIRVEKENSKYFSETSDASIKTSRKNYNPDDAIDANSYGYFSPSMVQIDSSTKYLEADAWNDDVVSSVEAALLANSEGVNVSSIAGNDESESEDQATGQELVAMTAFMPPLTISTSPQESGDSTADFERFIGTDGILESESDESSAASAKSDVVKSKVFLKDNFSTAMEGEKSGKQKRRSQKTKKGSYFNVKNAGNILDTSQMTGQEISQLPNQIKSLFMASSGNPNVNVNAIIGAEGKINNIGFGNAGVFTFNYELIGKVEYLVAFETAPNGDILTKAPQWSLLTKNDYDNYVGSEMLCRVKKYDCDILSSKKLDEKNIPIYNSYFILRPNNNITEVQTEEDSKEKLRTQMVTQQFFAPQYINTGVVVKNDE